MTYKEISITIEAYDKNHKEEIQMQALFTYKLGELIGIAVNDPKKYPNNAKEAFKQMKIFDEDTQNEQQDWQITKERINRYNSYRKMKRGEKN